MLMAKEGPFEKSTPEECTIALPLKLSAPDGSLIKWVSGIHHGCDKESVHNLPEVCKWGICHSRGTTRGPLCVIRDDCGRTGACCAATTLTNDVTKSE